MAMVRIMTVRAPDHPKDIAQFPHHPIVIPAQAGIQQRAVLPAGIAFCTADAVHWIPVFTGMTP
ncbi:hypothetical protein [Mariluticola halotolerans]|uniref:hypothetical protein n=1 Tax=Mariluticola halotolerans TaxID=2909283 RepID=UPI0026E1639C|nr:hypothetical protein [Mariluticola halotolerans]UJQ93184.1 hypothetical protein L1P08_09205 [Mariluticola halotolerans]